MELLGLAGTWSQETREEQLKNSHHQSAPQEAWDKDEETAQRPSGCLVCAQRMRNWLPILKRYLFLGAIQLLQFFVIFVWDIGWKVISLV